MIDLENISKTFKSKQNCTEALKNVNLKINDGEILGIIGESGAGKSTLLRCINLLERPDSGKVVIDGKDITSLNNKELNVTRRNIGMIFQHFNLLEQRNVIDNVCLPLEISKTKRNEALEKSTQLLEVVGLSDKAKAYPSQLSGGQKQRVAIARALATNPKYLLCDEITSALDPNTTTSILNLIKQINQTSGVTVVLITHEMDVVEKICDRVALLGNGEIVMCDETIKVLETVKERNQSLEVQNG
jgi:D-methionine transport system ATP-binding protein